MTIKTTLIILSFLWSIGEWLGEPICDRGDDRIKRSDITWDQIKDNLDPECNSIGGSELIGGE